MASTSPATTAADQVLTDDPFALLVGMMLDQQYPMEHAFRGPAKVLDRFGTLDPAAIAAADPEEFAALCSTPPAIHRFPGSMAARLQALAASSRASTTATPTRLWTEAATGADLLARVMELPGFGKQKAQIFVALLAKQLGVRPDGLGGRGGRYAEDGLPLGGRRRRPDSLQKVRDFKKQKKAAAKAAASRRSVGRCSAGAHDAHARRGRMRRGS